MSCSRNVHKIIKRVKLEVMSDGAAQSLLDVPYPLSLTTHSAWPFSVLDSPSHLPSQSPISHLQDWQMSSRKMSPPESYQTPSQSSCITHPKGWGLSLNINWLVLWTWLLCCPLGRWSSSGCDLLPLPWQIVFPFLLPLSRLISAWNYFQLLTPC